MERDRLQDDRGRPVRIIRSTWRALVPFAAPRGRGTADAVAAAAIPRDFVRRMRGSALASIPLLILTVRSVAKVLEAPSAAGWALWTPVALAAMWGVLFGMTWRSVRRHDLAVLNALREAGLCPSCGYALGGIPPEPDGCSACPECGSAWRRAGGPGHE